MVVKVTVRSPPAMKRVRVGEPVSVVGQEEEQEEALELGVWPVQRMTSEEEEE